MAAARLRYVNLPKVIEFTPIQKKTIRRICNPKSNPEIGKYFEISAPDYSFGPFYTELESDSCKGAKEKAWAKIIEKERVEPKKILLEKIEEEITKWKEEKLKEMRKEEEKLEKLEKLEEKEEKGEEIRDWKKTTEEKITEWKKRVQKEGTEWKKIIEQEGTEWKNEVEEKIIEIGRREWKKEEIDEHTNERYMAAMRKVEKEARAAYGGDAALVDLTESEFRWKMIKDGCFFLQLTLCLLNDSVLSYLNYPDDEDDSIFVKKPSTKTVMGLIRSMFLVGNQIPLVVLSELTKQECFTAIINDVKGWKRPSDMLSKQILYDLLVVPAISDGKSSSSKSSQSKLLDLARSMACWSIHAEKPTYYSSHEEKPSDLLHGLQLFLLGPADDQKAASLDEGGELPDEEFEDGDLEAGIKLKSHNPETDISEAKQQLLPLQEANFIKQISKVNAIKEELEKNKRLSASNLTKKGIFIWNNSKGGGSRGIDFRSRILWGSLFMPPLKVNHETNVLFTNLKYYEIVHKQKEVRSYINFLANLVSTYEDVNVLASNKIIDENTKSEDKDRFLEMLGNLSDKEEAFITHRHHSVMGRVKDYSVFPWHMFKYVAIFGFILTVLQTIFSILSYKVGVEQLHQQESNSTGRKFQFP